MKMKIKKKKNLLLKKIILNLKILISQEGKINIKNNIYNVNKKNIDLRNQ